MTSYTVTIHTVGTETYTVTAETPEEARENWATGTLVASESGYDGIESVTSDD